LAPILTAARRSTIVTTVQFHSFGTTALLSSPLKDVLLNALEELSKRHDKRETKKPALHLLDRPTHLSIEGTSRSKASETEAKQARREVWPAPSPPDSRPFQCPTHPRYPLLIPHQIDKARASTVDIRKPVIKRGVMSYSVHLITAPTADTPGTTFMLQATRRNYIFGSHAEGTQRAMTQVGARMTKVQDFFITGKMEWANIGGLVGMALTLADAASTAYASAMEVWRKGNQSHEPPQPPKLNVYGGPNLKHTLATCRRFIFRKGVPIVATEYKHVIPERDANGEILPTWQDNNIKVWALTLKPPRKELDPEEHTATSEHANYEQFGNHFEEYRALQGETADEREARYERIRSAVLGYMFNSDWNFDTLVERHISEVEMPTAMFIRNPDTHRIEPYVGPKPGGLQVLPDIKVLTRTPWPGAKVVALPPTQPAPESVSYIVRPHDSRGSFNPKRAIELGIKPGPNFRILAEGGSLQNEKGETITSDMVLGPDKLGHGVAILDIPSVEYLDSLLEREELQSEHIVSRIKVVYWVLGPGISGHPKLQQCMKKLSGSEHIVSSVDDCPNRLAFDSVAAQTTRLAQIDPVRYHIPFFDETTLPQNSLAGHESTGRKGEPQKTTIAERGKGFTLMPNFGPKANKVAPPVDIDAVRAAIDPEILLLAKRAQESLQTDHGVLQAWRQSLARPDTEVITLGTGSALPSKYRNVSATLLRVPGIGNYLFDCGENTLGQLQRVFNPEELIDVMKDLRMIWISHLHADHHLGTAAVIKAWYKLVHNGIPTNEQASLDNGMVANPSTFGLSVISHEGMLKWLREYSSVEDFGFSRILPFQISPVKFNEESGSKLTLTTGKNDSTAYSEAAYVLKQEDYKAVLGLTDIQACLVKHCHGAMAVTFTFPHCASDTQTVKPLKVSYSGDCRPCKGFTIIGRDSTVLIHEATFDDELGGDAKAKKHSTTSEALAIGASMNAQAVILTHFSQRYQKIPVLQPVQDGEQEDDLVDPSAMEDVQQDEGEQEDDIADMPTDAAATTSAPSANTDQRSSLLDYGRVVKVRAKDMKIAISFDYMRVKIGEIAQLERFNEALEKLLVKEDELEDVEGAKEGDGVVNSNGKKTSGDEQQGGGTGKKKKSKRNN
jgi:ribonuclease Z